MGSSGILITKQLGATLAVPDPARTAETLADAFEWQVHGTGDLAERWSSLEIPVPDSIVMGPPAATRGLVRLIRASAGEERGRLPRAWSSVEPVVRDLDRLVEELDRHPDFELTSPGVELDMRDHGSNIHQAAVARLHDCLFVLTMAVTRPAERDFPESPSRVGHIFAAHLRSTEADAARHLYADVFGMRPLMVVEGHDTFIHRFWGVDSRYPVRVDVLQGVAEGLGLGAVEVQSWPRGYLGRYVTEPVPPGIAAVTYQTPDLAVARSAVARAGITVVGEDPDGFVVRGAEGELLEVTSTVWI